MLNLAGSFSGSLTRVTGSLSNSTVLGASDARFRLLFHNNSDASVLVGFLSASAAAQGVSPSNYAMRLASGSFVEMQTRYTGPVSVCWNTSPSTGSLFITELF